MQRESNDRVFRYTSTDDIIQYTMMYLQYFVRATAAALLIAAGGWSGTAHAQTDPETTRVVVRAVSQDAKVIHDPVGGARITIRNVSTGRVLARGMQTGDSGSTEKIMRQPRERGASIYQGSAKYTASIPLSEPTVVEITAEGPLGYPQAIQKTSKTMLLLPGRHVEGDGVVLTLHGFIVEMKQPASQASVSAGSTVDVHATVRMMCGCPTAPGGLWDAERIDIEARLVRNGEVITRAPLHYTGKESNYEGSISVSENGHYSLQLVAADAEKVNFGIHERELRVE